MSFMDKMNSTSSNTINTNKTSTTSTATNVYNINSTPKHNKYGWICPVCGRGVSPDKDYCNCRGTYQPYYPYWGPSVIYCGNTPATTLSVNDYITTSPATIKTGDHIK